MDLDKIILSDKLFSPQEYLELLTDKCFVMSTEDNLVSIHRILKQENMPHIYDYALSNLKDIINGCKNVVLVEIFSADTAQVSYRWFELNEKAVAKLQK